MAKKMFIGNMDWSITSEALAEYFAQFGPVTEAIVMKDEMGRSRGFGFVTMENDEDADRAIEEANGALVGKRNITVSEARPREARERREFTPRAPRY